MTATTTHPPLEQCSLVLSTVQGGAFKSLVECLRDIIFDCSLTFSGDGVKISTMDGARCSLIHAELSKFETLHCPSPLECGVNLQNLYKLLRSITSTDALLLWIAKDAPSELAILISSEQKSSKTFYRYKLLDVDTHHLTLPETSFERVFTMPSNTLQRLARDMSALAETITIRSVGGDITFSCCGDFASQETTLSPQLEASGVVCHASGENGGEVVSNSYLAKYIQLFARASSLSNTVTLFLKNQFPLVVQYEVGGLGVLRFLLAPKTLES